MGKPHNFGDVSSIFDTFCNTCECLSAFSSMLDSVLFADTASSLHHHASGVITMLDQQIEDLQEIRKALRYEINISTRPPADADDEAELEAGMMEALRDSFDEAEIAAALRMQRERQNIIMANYLAGHDLDMIAGITGLRKGVVKRTLDQIVEATSDSFELPTISNQHPLTTGKLSELVKETSKGHDAEQIAKTLNLKASTVQRVIDVLMAGSRPVEDEATPQATSKAVNE